MSRTNGVAAKTGVEPESIGASCDFPGCRRCAELGSRMREYHVRVRLASNGSWADDTHLDGGHG